MHPPIEYGENIKNSELEKSINATKPFIIPQWYSYASLRAITNSHPDINTDRAKNNMSRDM